MLKSQRDIPQKQLSLKCFLIYTLIHRKLMSQYHWLSIRVLQYHSTVCFPYVSAPQHLIQLIRCVNASDYQTH